MHAVVRTYSGQGAKELLDVLEKTKTDIERLIAALIDSLSRIANERALSTVGFVWRLSGGTYLQIERFQAHRLWRFLWAEVCFCG
jgi:hypothetical protein